MPKAAKRSGLTQALGGMNRYLIFGYITTAAAFAANLVILKGAIPGVDGIRALFFGQIIFLALIPAAVLMLLGARRSAGRIRKVLAYSVFAFDVLASVSACVGVALFASGQVHTPAA